MSRAEWILGSMLIILLIVVAIIAVNLWIQPDVPVAAPQPALIAPTPAITGQTALSAASEALKKAQTWQADAVLLKATATWPQGANSDLVQDGKTAWSFTYYSAENQLMGIFTVIEHEASFLSEVSLDTPLLPISTIHWRIDSPTAVQTVLEEGGDRFMRMERITTLTMNLATVTEENRIEWFISLIGEQTGNTFIVRLDATSGTVLEIIEPT